MDHLPQASQPAFQYPQVPYVEGFTYDDGGFTGFPSRVGFDKKRLLAGDFTEHSSSLTIAFLQSWLYFGMTSEVFNTHVERDDFVVEEQSGRRVLTTKESLPPYIQRWLSTLAKSGLPGAQTKISHCLQEANEYAIHLSGGHLGGTQCPLPTEVSLSIMALGATLESSLSHKHKLVGFSIEKRKWGHSPILSARMASVGWCINDIGRLAEVGSVCLTYFASTIKRDLPAGNSHQTCTLERCVAHHVEGGSYPTKHVTLECQCRHIKVPIGKVIKILKDGGLPVVKLTFPPDNEVPVIDVVQYRLGLTYYALSHVWSDGLGNAQQNSLPACQLRRLHELASALKIPGNWFLSQFNRSVHSSSVHIWIDTLCVPLKPREFRRIAISRMAKTYAQASFVLVLDSEVQQVSMQSSVEELLVRVSCSGWMRRVWTLLEGSLGSQKLCVQFLDGVLRLVDTRKKLAKDWMARTFVTDSIPIDAGIFHYDLEFMRKAFHSTTFLPGDINDQSHAFGVALHGFIGRATSWKGDELICLAILLGFSSSAVTEIQDTGAEDREFKLLSLSQNIPHGLLFCSGPKFEQPGYRWMRRDFWRARPYAYYRPARLRPDVGLEVTLPGFILAPMLLPQRFFLFQNVLNQQWYKASYDSVLSNFPTSLEALEALGHAPETSQYGIICPTLNITRNRPHDLDHIPAALVSIYKRRNTTLNFLDLGRTAIYTRYICYIELTMPEPDDIELERTRNGEGWSKYMGKAEKAAIHVGETFRKKLGLQILSEFKQEYLDQTWYVS
ncbi:hypothetical protein MMC28_009782 [Mycoblastus sanguinarius]|nr:hypothetical protein [Mycoblastus sanguinarius]